MLKEPKVYSLKYEDNIGLVHLQAKFGYNWAMRMRTPFEYDDMFQEASLAFLTAVEGFDPDAGVKFSAYYTRVAFSFFKRAINGHASLKSLSSQERQKIKDRKAENKVRAASGLPELPGIETGLKMVRFSDLDGGEGDDFTPFIDSIASHAPTPEQALQLKQTRLRTLNKLSPLARLVVDWLEKPPHALLEELRSQVAHAQVSKAVGVPQRGVNGTVTVKAISNFLQLTGSASAAELVKVGKELNAIVKRMEAA